MGALGAPGIMKAGFGKIRNVALTYTLSPQWASRIRASNASITLTGANLGTIWRAQEGTFGAKEQDPKNRLNPPRTPKGSHPDKGLHAGILPAVRRFLATVRLSF